MFKVLHKTPTIPETLSSEGKDFLQLCFRRKPAERPSAAKLLEHPFVRNSNDKNVSVCKQAFSKLNMMASISYYLVSVNELPSDSFPPSLTTFILTVVCAFIG